MKNKRMTNEKQQKFLDQGLMDCTWSLTPVNDGREIAFYHQFSTI